jgi:hypothetical protein
MGALQAPALPLGYATLIKGYFLGGIMRESRVTGQFKKN